MMKHFLPAIVLALCTYAPAFAQGQGTAVGVNPDAEALTGKVERTLVVGTDVSVGDQVVTGPSGKVQLLFDDNTRIVVGPRSTLKIEAYLLNGGGGVDKFAVNALTGTFRFITGNSPKPAYAINTPTASIAVRGTKFDFTVADGTTRIVLFEGALHICNESGCFDLTRRCDIGVFGDLNGVFDWRDDRSQYDGNFPLPNIQSALLPDFRIAGAQACLSPPPPPNLSSGSPTIGTTPAPTTQQTTPTTSPTFSPTFRRISQ